MPVFPAFGRVRACAVGLAVAAAVTGCVNSGSDAMSDSAAGSEPRAWDHKSSREASAAPSPDATPGSVLHALKALDTADMSVPRGASYALEGGRDARGARIWEIEVASKRDDEYTDEYDLTVSEDGSKVLTKRQDKTPDDDVARMRWSKTTAQQAVRLAYMHRPAELGSLEIDTRPDGKIVWQVTMAAPGATDGEEGPEVILDSRTGNVLRPGTDD
jgi:hypothetical protein